MLFSRIYRCKTLIPKEVSALKEIEKAYTQHAKDVYRYLLSLTHDENLAEELTQETFFRAMRTIDRYDGSCKLSVSEKAQGNIELPPLAAEILVELGGGVVEQRVAAESGAASQQFFQLPQRLLAFGR